VHSAFGVYCVAKDDTQDSAMESQLTIRWSGALLQRLSRVANRLGRRRADLARLALRRYLDEIEGKAQPRSYDRAPRGVLG
jgi:metal-responsive CopG/Arc/MetJ family transcriptional regulator